MNKLDYAPETPPFAAMAVRLASCFEECQGKSKVCKSPAVEKLLRVILFFEEQIFLKLGQAVELRIDARRAVRFVSNWAWIPTRS